MKAFLKENSVLVAGVALPLILTIVFFTLTQMQAGITSYPDHNVLYTTGNKYNNTYKIIIKDEKTYLSFIPPKKTNNHPNYAMPRLYMFNAKTSENTEIDLPETTSLEEKTEILIDALKDYKISNKIQSPDGFRFTHRYRRNGNLMTEIFGGGYRSRSSYVLEKDGVIIRVPDAPRYSAQFVGWTL